MKLFKTIGMCILLFLLIGATYRISLSLLLNEYEEECYEYKIGVREEYYCNTNIRHASGCSWHQEIVKSHSIYQHEIDCNCPEYYVIKKNFTYITDECNKYHLIRKSKEITLPSAILNRRT